MGDRERAGGQQVEHVGERLHVLEVEVGRVVQIDVGLPDPVHEQQPPAGAVGVGQQLDLAAAERRCVPSPGVSMLSGRSRRPENTDVPALRVRAGTIVRP